MDFLQNTTERPGDNPFSEIESEFNLALHQGPEYNNWTVIFLVKAAIFDTFAFRHFLSVISFRQLPFLVQMGPQIYHRANHNSLTISFGQRFRQNLIYSVEFRYNTSYSSVVESDNIRTEARSVYGTTIRTNQIRPLQVFVTEDKHSIVYQIDQSKFSIKGLQRALLEALAQFVKVEIEYVILNGQKSLMNFNHSIHGIAEKEFHTNRKSVDLM